MDDSFLPMVQVTSKPEMEREAILSRAVLATAVDAIFTINSAGIITTVNQSAERMFGYSRSELLGHDVSMLMPQPFRSEHSEYVRRYLETGVAAVIGVGRRVTALRKDGTPFPVHLSVSELEQDGQRCFAGIIRDLSELDSVQKQLLQSERLAAIGQMVTGLAHESRNALQRARACLDMLSLELEHDPDKRQLVTRATTALKDLHWLYEEVRNYAAPIHPDYRECDLAAIWRREWDNLAAARADRTVNLIEELHTADLRLDADIPRLGQLFRNVFENALHVSPVGGEVLLRCCEVRCHNRRGLCVTIRDHGPGLTPAALQQVFEPFFTTKQKGTGLGMAIVHRIVTAHGGTISVANVPAGGAEFMVWLPRSSADRNDVR